MFIVPDYQSASWEQLSQVQQRGNPPRLCLKATSNEHLLFSGEDKTSTADKRCIFDYEHETWHDCSLGWLETFRLKFPKNSGH